MEFSRIAECPTTPPLIENLSEVRARPKPGTNVSFEISLRGSLLRNFQPAHEVDVELVLTPERRDHSSEAERSLRIDGRRILAQRRPLSTEPLRHILVPRDRFLVQDIWEIE